MLVLGRSTSQLLPHPGPGADVIGLRIARSLHAGGRLASLQGSLKLNQVLVDIHSPSLSADTKPVGASKLAPTVVKVAVAGLNAELIHQALLLIGQAVE
ncbi:hypothetical protein D3C81_1389480 [compost metagenome]